jgi:hypothetical protein
LERQSDGRRTVLRTILSAIRGAMRAAAKMVWVTFEVGGRLVSMMRLQPQYDHEVADVGGLPADGVGQAVQVPAATDLDRVRALATDLARNPKMTAAAIIDSGVAPITAAWLAGMPPVMLCRVALASDVDLAAAIAGRRNLRGVYPHNEPAPRPRAGVADDMELEDECGMRSAFA